MGKKGNRQRNSVKRKQKKALRDKARKRMTRKMMIQYSKLRRHQGGNVSLPDNLEMEGSGNMEHHGLDDLVDLPHCEGVGECCKDRFLPVEPSDIWRVLHNDRARAKWNVTHTCDLFGKGKPFIYDVDARAGVPGCAVVRVEIPGSETQACPFLELDADGKPECILGTDRLTACKADPICRVSKVDGKRRLSGWRYALNNAPCKGCMQAGPEDQLDVRVENWLIGQGMEERFLFNDMYSGFVEWLKGLNRSIFHCKMASMLLFNWHEFMIGTQGVPKDKVPWEEPKDPRHIFGSARVILEGIMKMDEQQLAKDKEEAAKKQADDDTKTNSP